MSDLKLFRITGGRAQELPGRSMAVERQLQRLIERNMETLFGVRFLASEFSTGPRHGGRMDSIGIDDTGSPVVFEYKRSRDENVINQALYYLDWLVDHRGDFQILVAERLGQPAAAEIDWTNPRVVCVAADFTKYDEYAVRQNSRNIELIRYRDFDGDLLALELLTSGVKAEPTPVAAPRPAAVPSTPEAVLPEQALPAVPVVEEYLAKSSEQLKNLFADLDAILLGFGDDVQKTTRKLYFAYKRLKNFACVEVHPNSRALLVYLKVDPTTADLVDGFSRDVRSIGHFGTGDLELRITNADTLARAEPLLRRSYDAS